MSNVLQLGVPTASLAQRPGATAISGGVPSGQTTGRTCNSLRISTEPLKQERVVEGMRQLTVNGHTIRC